MRGRDSVILAAMPALTLVTAAERPELVEAMADLGASPWPEFLNHGAVVQALWPYLYELAPDYQFALLDEKNDSLVAIGNAVSSCDMLLVLIGFNWINAHDEYGKRRLDDPDDFVVLAMGSNPNPEKS